MPRVLEFYGIAIYMYWRDQAPPHFHAIYAQYEAEVAIVSARVVAGRLPRRAHRLVRTWARHHQAELAANWQRAQNGELLAVIAPLE